MRLPFLYLLLLFSLPVSAQFSLSTDVSVVHNNSPQQQFWAAGQTIRAQYYATERGGPYLSITYYLKGKFTETYAATGKDPAASLPAYNYQVASSWQFRKFSLGWKHYFKGNYHNEKEWSFYGLVGTGVLFTRIENNFSQPVDTSIYQTPGPVARTGTFRRITLDLGLGGEWPIGADIFAFGELRSWLQASETPSPLVAGNRNIPLATSAHAGLRILIW